MSTSLKIEKIQTRLRQHQQAQLNAAMAFMAAKNNPRSGEFDRAFMRRAIDAGLLPESFSGEPHPWDRPQEEKIQLHAELSEFLAKGRALLQEGKFDDTEAQFQRLILQAWADWNSTQHP